MAPTTSADTFTGDVFTGWAGNLSNQLLLIVIGGIGLVHGGTAARPLGTFGEARYVPLGACARADEATILGLR
jgi:hypothetical protein